MIHSGVRPGSRIPSGWQGLATTVSSQPVLGTGKMSTNVPQNVGTINSIIILHRQATVPALTAHTQIYKCRGRVSLRHSGF